ncbi:hypothetical protein G9A89_001028 [Geosiphon pyriformis]|nr:hypothetical protein G9A89_001028 [Geosiphon pyriformis]
MIRVKDPKASSEFYQDVLGMKLIEHIDFPEDKFTLYFLAYVHGDLPESSEARKSYIFDREGILELTHNWGTENDQAFSYSNGNKEPGRGFGHIAIIVDDVKAACARFDQKGVKFVKRLEDGKMNSIAFLADPDGYWVEILPKRFSGLALSGLVNFVSGLVIGHRDGIWLPNSKLRVEMEKSGSLPGESLDPVSVRGLSDYISKGVAFLLGVGEGQAVCFGLRVCSLFFTGGQCQYRCVVQPKSAEWLITCGKCVSHV